MILDHGRDALERRLAGARLLLLAPHPDDESLALGGLIQQALRLGAQPQLLLVTDGDNNPWPQRWLERRWRIGPAERRRWAARRADELAAAMASLGLLPSTLGRMGWPDMGVAAQLREKGTGAIDAFAERIAAFAPDVVALPALGDRHPDHGACHVLACLALARLGRAPLCLAYLVHGRDDASGQRIDLPLDARMRQIKRDAVLAHASQVALSRGRLLAQVGAIETLQQLPEPQYTALAREQPLPWKPPTLLRPWLRLTVAHADGVHHWRWPDAPLRRHRGTWHLTLPAGQPCRAPAFVKLESRLPSPWIFDHWGWQRLTAAAPLEQAAHHPP